MTHTACAFITGRFCPRCGYELTGVPYAERVTCPECGARTDQAALGLAPPPGVFGKAFKGAADRVKPLAMTAGVIVVVICLASLIEASSATRCCLYWCRTRLRLMELYEACTLYATEVAGTYPKHAAALIPEAYLRASVVTNYSDQRVVGSYDLLDYDWSQEQTEKLLLAIASTDLTAPYYRLGDFWLVRLPGPTHSPRIVAGWSASPPGEGRWVVFDDGRVEVVEGPDWSKLWVTDTAARRKLGLPPVNPIPP